MQKLMKLAIASLVMMGLQSMADHHEMGDKGMMGDMKSEAQMKKAEMHEKMAVQHKALAECLKTNKEDGTKCETQKQALKDSRMAMKEHRHEMHDKMKEKRMKDK